MISKPKRKYEPVHRKPPAPRKRAKAVQPVPPPPIRNASPDDAVSLPNIVLDLDDNERFDDTDIEVLSRCSSSSQKVQVLPSPTYRLNATSDVSTERLSPRLSPDYPGLSTGSYSDYPSPDYGDFQPNPLADATWSSGDETE